MLDTKEKLLELCICTKTSFSLEATNQETRTVEVKIVEKSVKLLDYMSGATKLYFFKFVRINKEESLIIRCYQRYKYNFFEDGIFYRITNALIKGSDTVWSVKSSTIRSPFQCGTCPQHKTLATVFHVRNARNSIMHTADMKLSASDLQDYSQAMIDLLNDPGISCFQGAQLAVTEIQTVCMINKNIFYVIYI